jgi:hypothetical protein
VPLIYTSTSYLALFSKNGLPRLRHDPSTVTTQQQECLHTTSTAILRPSTFGSVVARQIHSSGKINRSHCGMAPITKKIYYKLGQQHSNDIVNGRSAQVETDTKFLVQRFSLRSQCVTKHFPKTKHFIFTLLYVVVVVVFLLLLLLRLLLLLVVVKSQWWSLSFQRSGLSGHGVSQQTPKRSNKNGTRPSLQQTNQQQNQSQNKEKHRKKPTRQNKCKEQTDHKENNKPSNFISKRSHDPCPRRTGRRKCGKCYRRSASSFDDNDGVYLRWP